MLPSLLLVASLVLPGVLGDCCIPDLFQSVLLNTKTPNSPMDLIQSFSRARYILKPLNPADNYQFIVVDHDFTYTMFKDGSCTYEETTAENKDDFDPCLSKYYNHTGMITMGESEVSNSYLIKSDKLEGHILVSQKECFPLMTIIHNKVTGNLQTLVMANVKVDGVTETELNKDLTTCVNKDIDVVG